MNCTSKRSMRIGVVVALSVGLVACGGGGGGAADVSGDTASTDAMDAAADLDGAGPGSAGDAAAGDAVAATDAGSSDVESSDTCPPSPVSDGAVRARLLACPADLPQGPFAAGQVGDVVLESSRARFVVRTRLEGHALSGLTGGHLVDAVQLAPDGSQRREDGLRELALAVDFWMMQPDDWEITAAGDAGEAVLRVTGALKPFPLLQGVIHLPEPAVDVVHEYVLRPDSATLEIRTTLTPHTPGLDPSVTLADVAFWAGEAGLFLPGLGADELPISASAQVMGQLPLLAEPTVAAYATARPEEGAIINASGITAFAWSDGFVPAEGLVLRRFLAVGSEQGGLDLAAAMASASGAFGGSVRGVAGTVTGAFPGLQIEAQGVGGEPLTRCDVSAEEGAFACEVPVDSHSLVAVWRGDGHGDIGAGRQHLDGAIASVELPDGAEPASELGLDVTPPARLRLTVRDDNADPLAFRVTLRTELDGEDLRISRHDLDGDGEWWVRAGTWEVWVHHGPFYEQHTTTVTLTAGETTTVDDVVLVRAVDTSGWIGADFHVHSETSTDSHTPLVQRLRSAVAEGLGWIATTDHDFVTDAASWAARAGVSEQLLVSPGVEVSTTDWGHFNVWPITPDPERSGQGAPAWFGLDALDLLALLDASAGFVQCNHPRFEGAGYFDWIGLDAASTPAALLDFDAMELINGIGHDDTGEVVSDWMALLNAGHRIVGTGTSDTHGTNDFVGNPRTMIAVPGADEGAVLSEEAALDALRAGRAVATAGPMLTVRVVDGAGGEAGIGETLTPADGAVTAHVEVLAPSWMALGTLHIHGASGPLLSADLAAGEAVSQSVEVPAGDAWVVAVHEPTGGKSQPGIHRPPWAISNPVWLSW